MYLLFCEFILQEMEHVQASGHKRKIEEDDLAAQRRADMRKFHEENKKLKQERREHQKKREEENRIAREKGRKWTLAIAVPGSLLHHAQSPEMKTYVSGISVDVIQFANNTNHLCAGQIARAACMFCADEVVVYDDRDKKESEDKGPGADVLLLSRILQYLECPQYLRKYLFPVHEDLKYVGLLNPLDAPHHLRRGERSRYREGITMGEQGKKDRKTFAEVGLDSNVLIFQALEKNVRVTVKMRDLKPHAVPYADAVTPGTPRLESGIYWGYDVRVADSLSAVLCQSPHEDGYDLTIGVGTRGDPAKKMQPSAFEHAIIIFPGVDTLEHILIRDDKLEVKDPADLFDCYVNTQPAPFVSSDLRAVESLLISLPVLKPKLLRAVSTKQSSN